MVLADWDDWGELSSEIESEEVEGFRRSVCSFILT